MLRFNSTSGAFRPFGNRTVKARKSGDLEEAHRQTENGQRLSSGRMPLALANEDQERREYAEPKAKAKA